MKNQILEFIATLKPDPTHPTLSKIPGDIAFTG